MLELGAILSGGEEQTIQFCQQHGLLLTERPCKQCMEPCALQYREKGHPRWICRKHTPIFSQSITNKTVFSDSHMQLDQLLLFFYMFAHDMTEYRHLQREISARPAEPPADPENAANPGAQRAAANHARAKWIQTSTQTIRQWLLYCREICFVFLDKKFQEEGQIGGEGIVVEIDECKIGRMKHHVGKSTTSH